MAQQTVAGDPLMPRHGLTRGQYDALVDTGVLEGRPVELLEGMLVTRAPRDWSHADAITELAHWLGRRLPEPWRLAVQVPLAASDDSEPEPDLAVVQRGRDGHPRSAALVIEVCGSSHRTDLVHKPRIYAAAKVEQYWVVDLAARQVVVHTDPRAGDYTSVRRLPWTTPLAVLDVPVDLAEQLGRP